MQWDVALTYIKETSDGAIFGTRTWSAQSRRWGWANRREKVHARSSRRSLCSS